MAVPYLDANDTIPGRRAADITTSNTTVYDEPTRAIYIGGAGNLKVDMVSGGTVTFQGLLVGTVLPIQVVRVYATGTTATNLIAIY